MDTDTPNTAGRAAWACLILGWATFLAPFPGIGMLIGWPLNLVAFILAIVAMSRRGAGAGIFPLLASLIASPIVYIVGLGILGSAVMSILNDNKGGTAPTAVEQKADTVRGIQTELSRLGFRIGPADGVLGAKTRDAIKNVQAQMNRPSDGEATEELLQTLREARPKSNHQN